MGQLFKKRYRALEEDRRQAREARRNAEQHGDTVGMQNAKHQQTEAGEALDRLDLFRKNLQSFVRAYEFLSQIVNYDDRELEQLCVFAKHLYPLLRIDRLDDEQIDVSELALTHYRLTKRAEHELVLGEQVMHGIFPKRVEDAVLDSMNDHEKLALRILDNEGAAREFARLILRLLASERRLEA